MIDSQLLNKYNIPVPRYTSYPTVPFWNSSIDQATWTSAVKEQFAGANKSFGISLYIHLPFCESLCTYCGCNKKITTNHSVEEKYMASILKEWNLYRDKFRKIMPLEYRRVLEANAAKASAGMQAGL